MTHFDADSGEPIHLSFDLTEPFTAARDTTHEAIYGAEVVRNAAWIRTTLYEAAPDIVFDTVMRLSSECWFEGRSLVTTAEFVNALRADPRANRALSGVLGANTDFAGICSAKGT